MTQTKNKDYVLGRNATDLARVKSSGTVVMSLRLSVEEFSALSNLAESEGKTVSQVAREGIRERLEQAGKRHYEYNATLGIPHVGIDIYYGTPVQTGTSSLSTQKEYTHIS